MRTQYVWCELTINNSGKSAGSVITIGVVYRSPNSGEDNDGLLFKAIRSAAHVIIMGDFNFPDVNWTEGFSGSKGIDFLEVV